MKQAEGVACFSRARRSRLTASDGTTWNCLPLRYSRALFYFPYRLLYNAKPRRASPTLLRAAAASVAVNSEEPPRTASAPKRTVAMDSSCKVLQRRFPFAIVLEQSLDCFHFVALLLHALPPRFVYPSCIRFVSSFQLRLRGGIVERYACR